MGNNPTLDCSKHNNQARKCKDVKEVYRIDRHCSQGINQNQPKFDPIYDEILSTRKKSEKINHYLNSCNHVMRYHNEDLYNGYFDKLNTNHCNLNECIMFQRNYRDNKFTDQTIKTYINNEKRSHNHDDIRQMLFFMSVDSMHEYLFHNKNDSKYFIEKRNFIKQLCPEYYNNSTTRYMGINNQTQIEEKCIPPPKTKKSKKKQSMSITVSTTTLTVFSCDIKSKSNKSQSKPEKYKNGKSFIYDPNKKHKSSYVGCHYLNLQEELHEECGLSKRMWSGFVMKSKQLQETHEVKRVRHRKNLNKSLSTIRVLILFIYTSYEKFQKRLNELARVTSTANKMDERKAKKQHSKLGHSFKMLIETVQNYGLINSGETSINVVYRGISILPLFCKYLLTCYSPCSTSRSKQAAISFAGNDNGSVLQLSIPNNSVYFDMQFISIYKLEFELLFYGLNSLLCMEYLYYNVGLTEINLTPMVLLEKITGASNVKYPKQSLGNNGITEQMLSELLNNEYKEDEKNDENNISLKKEFEYFIKRKRMLVLKDASLMKLLSNGCDNNQFDHKYLDVCKIIKLFKHTRYLMIVHSYSIYIECIVEFCVSNIGQTFENKLRSIELDHKYNKNELNKIQKKLGDMWRKDSLWEPFFEENVIKFKKDVVTNERKLSNGIIHINQKH